MAALSETVNFHQEITPRKIEHAATEISEYIRSALIDINVKFVSSNNQQFTSNVIILEVSRKNRAELLRKVFNEAGIILAGTGGLRLSPHIYNTTDHADRAVRAINNNRYLLG